MKLPLCVDLDGTLIYNDISLISYGDFIVGHQFHILKVFYWLLKGGRSLAKYELARATEIDPTRLLYNQSLLKYLKEQKETGRQIVLATGCNEKFAHCVAEYLGIFDAVFASTKSVNLVSKAKARKLVEEFGDFGFAYIGNSRDDLRVWNHSGEIIVVNPDKGVIDKLKNKEYWLFA